MGMSMAWKPLKQISLLFRISCTQNLFNSFEAFVNHESILIDGVLTLLTYWSPVREYSTWLIRKDTTGRLLIWVQSSRYWKTTPERLTHVVLFETRMCENQRLLTSPMAVGVAPMNCWSMRMSLLGPAIRDVPVSAIAWHPWGVRWQKPRAPWTFTLYTTQHNPRCLCVTLMMKVCEVNSPVYSELPVALLTDWNPVHWRNKQRFIHTTEQHLSTKTRPIAPVSDNTVRTTPFVGRFTRDRTGSSYLR